MIYAVMPIPKREQEKNVRRIEWEKNKKNSYSEAS